MRATWKMNALLLQHNHLDQGLLYEWAKEEGFDTHDIRDVAIYAVGDQARAIWRVFDLRPENPDGTGRMVRVLDEIHQVRTRSVYTLLKAKPPYWDRFVVEAGGKKGRKAGRLP